MVYRDIDELAAKRASARMELEALPPKGAPIADDDQGRWVSRLPFSVVATPAGILRGEVEGWVVIRVGIRPLAGDDFNLVRAAVRRLWPPFDVAHAEDGIAIDGRVSSDTSDNRRRLRSILADVLSALHRLTPVEYVTIAKPSPGLIGPRDPEGPPQAPLLVSWLIPMNGPAAFTTVALREGENTLDEGVQIRVTGSKAILTARKPVMLNGCSQHSHELLDNDRFIVGVVEYVFKSTETEAHQPLT